MDVCRTLCVLCAQLRFTQLCCIAIPQHVFLGKKKTGLPMAPGGQSRTTEGPSSQKHDTFLWLLLVVACPVTNGLLGWIMPRVDLFLKSASCFPLPFNLGWLVVLPGTGGGIHKPGSRMLVLRGQGCFPSRVGL